MKTPTLLSGLASLTFLGSIFVPVQAQRPTINKPNANLVAAIRSTIGQELGQEYSQPDSWERTTYHFTEIDLNNDGNKEVIVGIKHGYFCNNRHCPVYIYQQERNSGNYHLVSSIFTSHHGLEVAVLDSRSHGWLNLASIVFTYEPREEAWRVFQFDDTNYELTPQKLSSAPNHIVLEETTSTEFNLADPGE